MRHRAAAVLLVLLACGSPGGPPPAVIPPEALATRHGNADELLVVDCLLPGQVRQMGSQLTYMTARRPVRTSQIDCALRGGEFVAYDRASAGSALAVWMPRAEAGDATAQNYVGEIYERGLGAPPDYAKAAAWYRKAADQGFGPAQTNLGQLYELGRGVPKDLNEAMRWYRASSGLAPEVPLVVAPTDQAELDALRKQLSDAEREAERLRGELEQVRRELERARQERGTREQSLDRDRRVLEEHRLGLRDEERRLAEDERTLAREREALDARRAELEQEKGRLAESALVSRQSELDRLDAKLKARQRALSEARAQSARAARDLAETEARLEERRREIDALDQRIAALSAQASAEERKLAEQRARTPERSNEVEVAGPTITMIDPRLPPGGQRGLAVVGTAPTEERVIHGRVEAPGGLSSLLVNDSETRPGDNGLFKATVPVRADGTRVTVVAIDKLGNRTDVGFMLSPSSDTAVARPGGASETPGIQFGNYYALVIGNNAYTHLPRLEMARNDARAISNLLETRYGFQVTTLYDATRYQILTALNELRARLTEKDNLLIYYAGHGELDKVNMRGHWLPVDAEAESSANWISNVQLTDVLNAMSVKHVLVIADSCYSGTLTRSSLARLDAGMSRAARTAWQRKMVDKRARTALTSGGLAPVMDAGGGSHSVFAKALIDVLADNDDVLEGARLHLEVKSLVAYQAARSDFEQLPQYAPIKFAGHESGDFFFVPRPDHS